MAGSQYVFYLKENRNLKLSILDSTTNVPGNISMIFFSSLLIINLI